MCLPYRVAHFCIFLLSWKWSSPFWIFSSMVGTKWSSQHSRCSSALDTGFSTATRTNSSLVHPYCAKSSVQLGKIPLFLHSAWRVRRISECARAHWYRGDCLFGPCCATDRHSKCLSSGRTTTAKPLYLNHPARSAALKSWVLRLELSTLANAPFLGYADNIFYRQQRS